MLKRSFAMLLAIVLVLSLLPMSVIAESTAQKNTVYTEPLAQHNHAATGDSHICEHCVAAGKTGDAAVPQWQALTGTALPTTTGHYYLTGDITVDAKDLTNADVVLCLNGYTVTAKSGKRFYTMKKDAKFTVLDCTAKTVTPENEDDTGYRAGKMVVSTDYAFMFANDSGNNAQLFWYDGILTGGRKAATGGLMSVQQSCDVYFYGGEVRDNSTGTGTAGGPIYLAGSGNTFHAENTAFIGNHAAGRGGVFAAAAAAVVELENCLFKDNSAGTNGGVFCGDNGLKVTARNCTFENNDAVTAGGVFYGKGGFFKAYSSTITGSNAKDYSAVAGTGGGVQMLLDSCRITDNAASNASGAVFVPNSSCPLTVSGNTYIYGNTRKGGVPGNIHLQSDNNGNYPVVTVTNLTTGAKIGINLNSARLEASKVLSKALGGSLTRAQVIEYFYSDDTAYMIDLADDKLVLAQGHVHTAHLSACDDAACTGHENALYLPWTDGKKLPDSGSYYLDTDVELDADVVMSTGTLNLCLNGHTVTFGGKRFALTGDANVNITDCSAKTENEVYTAGKLTGATNCMFQVNGDTDGSGKKTVVNLYEGIITENSRPKDHAAVVFIEKKAVFNMYGGLITENTVGAGSTGRGGVIYLQDNTVTFNMYGGKITNNHAVKNGTYGGNGGAVYSRDRGIVNILGGEISGNIAETDGGAIWAKGGSVTVKNAKITGNEAKNGGSAIYGAGSSVQITLENAELTGNKAAKMGAVYTPNNGCKITLKGATKVTNNQGGNVYLVKDSNTTSPNHSMVAVSGLTTGARIGITMPEARIAAQPYATATLGGALTEEQVMEYFFADNADYEVILKDDRLLLQLQGSGHKHCVCGVDGCNDHAQILCKPWTDAEKLPTSGSYYLETDVTTKTQPALSTGTLNLCLNGHTITIQERFAINGDATLNITDCTAKTDNGAYLAGSITGANGCVFYMTGDNSGKQSAVNFYQGVITGNHRSGFHAAVAYIQSNATFNLYNGVVSGNDCDSSADDRGGIFYIQNKTGAFNMYGGTIVGNKAKVNASGKGGHGGAVYNNGGTVKLLGGTITSNFADGNGAAICTIGGTVTISNMEISENRGKNRGVIYSDGGTLTIENSRITDNFAAASGGAIWAKGGSVTVKNTTITGNESSLGSAIYGAGGGVQIALDNAVIEGNKATATGNTYGAVYIPNGSAKITVSGATKVENNQGGNLFLTKDTNAQNPNHPMVTVDGLTDGAKIGITMLSDRLAAQSFASNALNGQDVAKYFFCDMAKYSIGVKDDRLYVSRVYEDIGHSHCACGADLQGCDHEKITYLAWDDPNSLPTSGNYCLTVDVKTSQNVSLTGDSVLNLCLNGHTIEAAGKQEGTWQDRIFDIKERSTLNISDCTGKGQLTGGTYGVVLFENNEASKTTFNLYGGHIVGNKSVSIGGAVVVQGSGTFNMYGGEIHGNSMNGWITTDENGNPKLDADGNQQTSGTSNGGGAIGLNGAKTTFNMYGGKIYDNECLPTTYLKADGTEATAGGKGGAIFSTRGTVNIAGGEISGNRAQQGGGIYAVIYSTINVSGGEIRENTTTHHGGGIFADNCYVTVSGGKITKNDSGEKGSGGGMQISNGRGFLKITGGEITDNKGFYGGGIMCQGRCPITIEGGLIARNSADTAGGVYISTMSPAKMTGGTITENHAINNAGGLYALRTVLDFTGGEISKNTSDREAGGVFLYGATINIDGGKIAGNTSSKHAGGISTGRLTVKGASLEDKIEGMNNLPDGDGVQFRATVNLISGSIEGNVSGSAGGGVLLQGYATMNIKGGSVKNNQSGSSGGGVYSSNNCTINMSGGTFSGNNAGGTGGGVYMTNSEGTFSGGVFEKNVTKKQGAGICASASKVKLSGVVIRNHNHQGTGGGYTGFNSTTTVTGGSISNNHGKNNGGGMYLQRGTLYVYGGTFANNTTGGSGAAIHALGVKAYLHGGYFAGNKCEGTGGGVLVTGRYGYKENGVKKEDVPYVEIHGGTYTENYARNGGAFLIQAGATLKVTGGTFTKNEAPSAGGAFYISNNIKFEITGGTFTENKTNGDGGAINFQGPQGIMDGGDGKIIIENNRARNYGGGFNITGQNADVTVKNLKVQNCFAGNRGGGVSVNTKAHANFEGLEICNNHSDVQGGGVYVGHAPVVSMKNVHIHHNDSLAAGAGIATECDNEFYLEDCVIENNETVTKAGGVYVRSRIMHLKNCKIINNVAGGDGGGLATGYQFGRGGEIGSGNQQTGVIIENCEISGNTAAGAGGGVHNNTCNHITLINSRITGNTSGTEGSGVWAREDVKMVDTTITGNTSKSNGYAVYLAEANYDGQSYIQAVYAFGGDMIVKDNEGGDVYMGPVNAAGVSAEGLTEGTDFYITLDSGLLTRRLFGVYNYEKNGEIYHVTAGDRSLTDPEVAPMEAPEVTEPGESVTQEESGNTGLYLGIGGIGAVVVIAALVLILVKKKKPAASGENK